MLFIRGGWPRNDPWARQYYTGLPSRAFRGPFYFRFLIGDRLSGYEWGMVLGDRHPYVPWYGDVSQATFEQMRKREDLIEADSPRGYAIYRELKAEVEGDRLIPLRREWCIDRRNVVDCTRTIFGLDQVLPIVRRRGDHGWLIDKLLAAANREKSPAAPSRLNHQLPRQTADGGSRPARGRRPGSGAIDDDTRLREMLHLLAEDASPSVYGAAGKMVEDNCIGASSESAQRRLARKFGKRFGKKPPAGQTWKDIEHEHKLNSNS
jgi:hypothetical protein